jgi:hypothetical protein
MELAAGQLEYCWKRFEEALDAFISSKRGRPYVIIVQSDHGFRWNRKWETLASQRGLSDLPQYKRLPYAVKYPAWPAGFANYMAVVPSPSLDYRVPERVTVAALLPGLLNQIFGMSVPVQETQYFTGGRVVGDPWVDCTADVEPCLLPAPASAE